MKLFPSTFYFKGLVQTPQPGQTSATFKFPFDPPSSISGKHCRLKVTSFYGVGYNAALQFEILNLPQRFSNYSINTQSNLLSEHSSITSNIVVGHAGGTAAIQNATYPEVITFIPDGIQELDIRFRWMFEDLNNIYGTTITIPTMPNNTLMFMSMQITPLE